MIKYPKVDTHVCVEYIVGECDVVQDPQSMMALREKVEGEVVDSGLLPDVLTAENLSKAFGQSIALDYIDGRYFARRTRTRAAHRRRM